MTPTLTLPLPSRYLHSHPFLSFLLLSLLSLSFFPSLTARSPSDVDHVTAHLPFNFKGPTVPPNFASFSVEPYALFDWSGRFPHPVNPTFIRLISQLHPTPASPGPTLRIGGNSADMASYNPHHSKRPSPPYGRGLWYDITDNDLQSMNAAARAINGSLVLGVNFRTPGDASVAIAHLQAVEKWVGWDLIEGVEIGNEPDVYEWTQLRPSGYNLSSFIEEWTFYAKALHKAIPNLPQPIFQGGAFGSLAWSAEWHRFMSNGRNYLKSMAFHHYPLSLCQGGTPTVHRLLSDQSSQGAARALMKSQALNHVQGYGLPLVVSEGSSVSCGRMPGVSNSYAAALWAIDEMLVDASIGIQSWHFHYAGGNTTLTYSPLVKQGGEKGKDVIGLTVMPIYYGLRFFALATLNYSAIYRVNVTDSTNSHVKVYSLISKGGTVQVVLLHKDASTTRDAVVALNLSLPLGFSALPYASVLRLTAATATSVNGVRLGGQTYDGTVDGEMKGEADREWLKPINGLYSVQLPRLSAVLLTLSMDGPYQMDEKSDGDRSSEGGSAVGMGATWQHQPAHAPPPSLEEDSTAQTSTRTFSSEEDEEEEEAERGTTADAPRDGIAVGVKPAPGAGMSASRRGRSAELRAEENLVKGAMAAESWRARRGKFALSDAKRSYEQQMEDRVEKALSERRRTK